MATAVSTLLATGSVAQDNTGSFSGMMDGKAPGDTTRRTDMTFRPAVRVLAVSLWALTSAPTIAAAHHSTHHDRNGNEAIKALNQQTIRENPENPVGKTSSGLLEKANRKAPIPETENVD